MKAIENISKNLEKIILKGLEQASASAEVKIFMAEINLYYLDGIIFVYFKNSKTTSGGESANLYEIDKKEAYYLSDTLKRIVEKISLIAEDEEKKEKVQIFKKAIEFCKNVGFDTKDLEEELEKNNYF